MTQEEKQLLLVDLCGRLPYGVKALYKGEVKEIQYIEPLYNELKLLDFSDYTIGIEEIKPYLRPMSNMTEEEARDIAILHGNKPEDILSIKVTDEYIDIILDDGVCGTITSTIWYDEIISSVECLDYLNKKMFDYRGLIPKDQAISTEEFNPYKD